LVFDADKSMIASTLQIVAPYKYALKVS
jgi:RNA polymerase subunit RPABC4/transcription elongation factor Spt4